MTSLNPSDTMRLVPDPAMSNASGPIVVDSSSEYETFQIYALQTAARSQVAGDPPAYNQVEIKFISDVQPGHRVRFDKSYLKVDYYAADITNPQIPIAVNNANVSVPWNIIAAIFRDAEFQVNADVRSVEKYTAEFGHANMIKILHSYTSQSLEAAHDRFFTPCIESTRDLTTGLSTESAARSARWLTTAAGNILYGSKMVMLNDIFDCMRVPAAWLINKLQLIFNVNASNSILIASAAAIGINKFFVTGVTLYLCQNKLTKEQIDLDTKCITEGEDLMKNAYRRFEATTTPITQSVVYDLPGVKNLQAAIAMISSTQASDAIGVNPYQYCYGSGIVANTGVTGFQMRYGSYYSPLVMINVSRTEKSQNIDLFAMWRLVSRTINDKTFTSSISYNSMALQAALDTNPYVFFSSVFANQECAAHKQISAVNHVTYLQGSTTTNGNMHVVRIRLAAVQIKGDLSVTVLE